MENTVQNKNSTSWNTVIILLILFWPIGLFLLYKKINADKASALQKSKTLNVVGWIFIFFAVVYFLACVTGNTEAAEGSSIMGGIFTAIVFFGGGGTLMIYISKQMNSKAVKIKKYISIIINNHQTSIDNIAAAIPTNYNQAVKDLSEMIDKGYFANAYIDASSREVILPQKQTKQASKGCENSEQNGSQVNFESKPLFKIVICKNCGANNKMLDGTVSECEYCDTLLN